MAHRVAVSSSFEAVPDQEFDGSVEPDMRGGGIFPISSRRTDARGTKANEADIVGPDRRTTLCDRRPGVLRQVTWETAVSFNPSNT